jgi:hypothetical protein
MKFDIRAFRENLTRKLKSLKSDKVTATLHEGARAFIIYR